MVMAMRILPQFRPLIGAGFSLACYLLIPHFMVLQLILSPGWWMRLRRCLGGLRCWRINITQYIYAKAVELIRWPAAARAMWLAFRYDRTCQVLDEQYMLGDRLLVGPIFNEHWMVEYYVPLEKWTGLVDGKLRIGPGWVKKTHGYLQLPLLLRGDKVLLIGTDGRPDYEWGKNLKKAGY